MPKYKYRCDGCKALEIFELPISTDPNKLFCCGYCEVGNMKRIISNQTTFSFSRDTVGKWYKKKTGKELLGGD